MANEIDVRLASKDEASAGIDKVSSSTKRLQASVKSAGLAYEHSQIRLEKAQERLRVAQATTAKGSLKEREALLQVAKAEEQVESAERKRQGAQRRLNEAQEEGAKSAGKLKKALQGAGKSASNFLRAQAVEAGAQKLSEFFHSTVEAASNLGESVNAVNKVFGASSKEVQDWGKNNAASFGLSKRAFNELAVPLGAGLKNAGLSLQDTTKWTIDLTKRAADMASVFRTTVPEALEAIQAGLRGESDPLERFGVGLSAAAVEAAALAETGKENAKQLTDQEKAMARLNLIMDQTASTQGDFAETSDQYANAQRTATGQMEDAKAKIGEALLPAMAKLTVITGDAASKFSELPGPIQATAAATAAAGTAFLVLAPRIEAIKGILPGLGSGALAADRRLGRLARTAGKAVAGFAALKVAESLLASGDAGSAGVDTTTLALQRLAAQGDDTSGVLAHLDKDLYKIGASDWGRRTAEAIESVPFAQLIGGEETFAAIEERFRSYDAALAAQVSSGNAEAAAEQWEILKRKAQEQDTSLEKLTKAFPEYQNALDHVQVEQRRATEAGDDGTRSLNNQAKAMREAREQAEELSNALLKDRGSARGFQAAIDDATSSVKENGRTLDIDTAKGRANEAALDDIASSTIAWRQAAQEAGASLRKQSQITDQGRAALIRAARQMGMSRAAAKRLANELLGIPRTVQTAFRSPGLSGSLGQVQRYRRDIARINGKIVTVHYRSDGTVAIGSGGAVARATGGIIGAQGGGPRSGLTLVGEHGRELIRAAPGSQVHSNPDTERILAGAQGGRQQEMRVTLDVTGADREFVAFLQKILRVNRPERFGLASA